MSALSSETTEWPACVHEKHATHSLGWARSMNICRPPCSIKAFAAALLASHTGMSSSVSLETATDMKRGRSTARPLFITSISPVCAIFRTTSTANTSISTTSVSIVSWCRIISSSDLPIACDGGSAHKARASVKVSAMKCTAPFDLTRSRPASLRQMAEMVGMMFSDTELSRPFMPAMASR